MLQSHATLLLTALIASVRLLPGVLTFGQATNVFQGSFQHVTILLLALAGQLPTWVDGVDWFDCDMYIGYVGLALVCVGMLPQRAPAAKYLNGFLFPAAVLVVLASGNAYERTLFRLPGFVSERIVTRFLIIPVLALLICGIARVDRWNRSPERSIAASVALLLGSWFLVVQLMLRAFYIRPTTVGRGLPLPLDVIKHVPVEPAYFRSVWIGMILSAAALLWIGGLGYGAARSSALAALRMLARPRLPS